MSGRRPLNPKWRHQCVFIFIIEPDKKSYRKDGGKNFEATMMHEKSPFGGLISKVFGTLLHGLRMLKSDIPVTPRTPLGALRK